MPRISVIVPTYCEAENLSLLIPRVETVAREARLDYELIIVDDNSPDPTARRCDDWKTKIPLKLLIRYDQRGLSSAVVHGMRAARGDILLCMDADLSHPPEMIPQMVAALDDPHVDFVIGSRYVAGGKVGNDWGELRRLNSKLATLLARPLTSVKDPMAGFFALRRNVFLRVADELDPIGYKIGLELMVKASCENIVEVPITFHNRRHGTSKLSWRQQWNYIRHLKRLLYYHYREKTHIPRVKKSTSLSNEHKSHNLGRR